MSSLSGSDRDASRAGPYVVDKFAYFRDHSSPDHTPPPGTQAQPHARPESRAEYIDVAFNSSPNYSRRRNHYRRESDADRATQSRPSVKADGSHNPVFALESAQSLSDPSGGSTAVSSNAASVLDPSPPPVSIQPSASSVELDDSYDAEMSRLAQPDGKLKTPQQVTPPSSTRLSSHQSPKHACLAKKQTPKKSMSDVNHVTSLLRNYSTDIPSTHKELCLYVLKSTKPTDTRVKTGIDWFADVNLPPLVAEAKGTTMKIRVKQHFRGRKSDSSRDSHYLPVCVKSNKDAVPRYRFHHTEIVKNVLSPNSMLKFVPVIRDLEPDEERDYLLWLKELERMDASCGFKTLGSRELRVARTIRKERTATLSLFLDSWLKKLAIDNCNRTTLIRHMANSESDDAITPQQKTSLVNLHSDDNLAGTPRALKAARVFTEAFDQVFYYDAPSGRGILLRDVLKLDKSVDEIVDAKKTAKGAQDDSEKASSLEHWIETHTVMGCLICYSNSCEHGDYSLENHKRNFSMDCIGMYGRMFSANRVIFSKDPVENLEIPPPCKRQCYRINGTSNPGAPSRPWTKDETLLLRSLFTMLDHNKVRVKAQCATAEILDRDCRDVHRHLQSLDISLPPVETRDTPRAKNLPWYDRKKKMLTGDWQDQTIAHDTKVRPSNDPCHHDGPCSAEARCSCVLNNILCERFCRCTEECCPYKFTGCGCHASGKTCLQKQKEGRPCICVQLNRECDPDLCGTCGAKERADPANRDDESLFQTGCQNTAIQRGVSKAVVLGKSQLEGCGYGLFTAEDIAQDEFVIEYTGELIVADEGVRREARRGEAFATEKSTSYVFSLLDYEGIWVDAAIYGNLSRYINHAVEAANVQPSILYVNGEFRIRFTATRNIKLGEELFFNYGENFPNLTKKMIKEKADNEEEAAAERTAVPLKRGRGRGRGRRPRINSEKPSGQTFTEAKIAKDVRTGARKEAPKLTTDDYEALADFEVMPSPSRKRKRVARSDDEEEYHPSLESEEYPAQNAGKRGSAGRRRIHRMKSKVRSMQSESEAEDSNQAISLRVKRGRGRSSNRFKSPLISRSILVKPATVTSPRKKRRGRPPKNLRSASPAMEKQINVNPGGSDNFSSLAAPMDQDADGGTISVDVSEPPKSSRGRTVVTRGFGTQVSDHMDVDEENAHFDADLSRLRGRQRNEGNTITARGSPHMRRVSASQAHRTVAGSDEEYLTRTPASRRRARQRRTQDLIEVNDSEASFHNQEAKSDSEDAVFVSRLFLSRGSRNRKLPARYRSSDEES